MGRRREQLHGGKRALPAAPAGAPGGRRVRAVFLDRDGTIIHDVHFLRRPEDIRVLPGACGAIRALREAGFKVVVVSNQSGVARGYVSEDGLAAIERELARRLEARGARVDRWYYCPHLDGAPVQAYDVSCECRKPKPGMILRAATELGIDLARSSAVGDSPRDIEAARAAGVGTTVLLAGRSGADRARVRGAAAADHVARDLRAAAAWIVARQAVSRGGGACGTAGRRK